MIRETEYDIAVIGGGPAGMAAALAASRRNEKLRIVIIERDERLGGILNQCIHNGFGLHYFGEELTGPEYAARFVKEVEKTDIKVMTETFALNIGRNEVFAVSAKEGLIKIKYKSLVLAMGCRERTAGAIGIGGMRPVGIWAAGMAQRLANIEGLLVGKKAVILGSGDIGLIMARRMVYEGAEVRMVCEIMPYSGGLKRNIVQCLEDNGIPLRLSTTVTRVKGEKRVEGVYIAKVDAQGKPIAETEEFVECDCLLLSVGLIPENDLLNGTEIEISAATNGPAVNENRRTNIPGVFSCGNSLHVHDLVDNVSRESEIAGEGAADYASGRRETEKVRKVIPGEGVRYVLPQVITGLTGEANLFFRVRDVYKGKTIRVLSGTEELYKRKAVVLTPGEMESVTVKKESIKGDIRVTIE